VNGFAPNSHGRRVWSIARTSLKVKDKSQRSRSAGTKNDIFSALSAARLRFTFGNSCKISFFGKYAGKNVSEMTYFVSSGT